MIILPTPIKPQSMPRFIGRNLAGIRKANGWSQDFISQQVRPMVNRCTVSRWETGESDPGAYYLYNLVSVLQRLGIDVDMENINQPGKFYNIWDEYLMDYTLLGITVTGQRTGDLLAALKLSELIEGSASWKCGDIGPHSSMMLSRSGESQIAILTRGEFYPAMLSRKGESISYEVAGESMSGTIKDVDQLQSDTSVTVLLITPKSKPSHQPDPAS